MSVRRCHADNFPNITYFILGKSYQEGLLHWHNEELKAGEVK